FSRSRRRSRPKTTSPADLDEIARFARDSEFRSPARGREQGEGNLAKAFPHPPFGRPLPRRGRGENQDEALMNASPSSSDHIVKSYDDELKRLTGEIQRMGDLALAQLDAAIDAVMQRDSSEAMKVVQSDGAIDVLEQEVSHDVVRLLALRQPMARDLREILA